MGQTFSAPGQFFFQYLIVHAPCIFKISYSRTSVIITFQKVYLKAINYKTD